MHAEKQNNHNVCVCVFVLSSSHFHFRPCAVIPRMNDNVLVLMVHFLVLQPSQPVYSEVLKATVPGSLSIVVVVIAISYAKTMPLRLLI